MKFNRATFLLFLFVCTFGAFTANSQTMSRSSLGQTVRLTLDSKTNFENGLIINQSFLNSLAAGSSKPLQQLEIIVEVVFRNKFVKTDENSAQVWIDIVEMNISGDEVYRGFSVEPYLKPDIFSGSFMVTHFDKPMESYNFKITVSESMPGQSIGRIGFEPTASTKLQTKIDVFSYTAKAKEAFQMAISRIDHYWAVNALIDKIISEGAKNEIINQMDVALVFSFRERIRKARLFANELLTDEVIKLPNRDPSGISEKIKSLDRLFTRYTTLFNSLLEKQSPNQASTYYLVDAYVQSMLKSFSETSFSNFSDNELLIKVSRLNMDSDLNAALQSSSPAAEKQLAARYLYSKLIHIADSLLEKSDISNAIMFYEDVALLATKSNISVDRGRLQNKIDAAKLGLLQSYLRIATRAVETGNDALAAVYTEKANEFASKQLHDYLIGQYTNQANPLILSYINKGNNYIDNKQFTNAIQTFETALSIARNYYNTYYKEQITQGLFSSHRSIYLDIVNQSRNYLSEGNIEMSSRFIQQALDYRQDHINYLRSSTEATHLQSQLKTKQINGHLQASGSKEKESIAQGSKRNSQLQSYLREYEISGGFSNEEVNAAKSKIDELINLAQLKVWGNAMDTAWKIYAQAIEIQKKYKLTQNNAILNKFALLDQRIIERICLNNQFKYTDLMRDAKLNIASNNYNNLQANLSEALNLGTSNQGCGLNIDEAKRLYDFYYPLFQYQKDYLEVQKQLYNFGMYQTVDKYIQFDKNIAAYELQRFNVQHLTLKEFVLKQKNLTLVLQVMAYFMDEMNVNNTLEYFEVLKKFPFTLKETFEMQQKMGALLAVADYSNGLHAYEARILHLVSDDERLRELKKAYLRAMKQLTRNKPNKK